VEINVDNGELETYWITRHHDCITGAINNQTVAEGNIMGNSDVLKQLTASIACQTEEATTSNQLRKEEIKQKKEHNNEKKDRTKRFLHPLIIHMLKHASAASRLETNAKLPQVLQEVPEHNQPRTCRAGTEPSIQYAEPHGHMFCSQYNSKPIPWQIYLRQYQLT
jgi:hypothetical protein